jgi:hypothetical protein
MDAISDRGGSEYVFLQKERDIHHNRMFVEGAVVGHMFLAVKKENIVPDKTVAVALLSIPLQNLILFPLERARSRRALLGVSNAHSA